MNIHSLKKMAGENMANIGLYFMVFIVNIKCVQQWLQALAESWAVVIIASVHRYTGSLKVKKV